MGNHIVPILLVLRRSKIGAILIIVQIAITLAIVSNALFVVKTKLDEMNRPSGIDEENIFTLYAQWIDPAEARNGGVRTDLAELRSLPGVVDAYASGSFPLAGAGLVIGVQISVEEQRPSAFAALYDADAHALNTLGAHLVAGRWFQDDDVQEAAEATEATAIVITQDLADKLFLGGSALGKNIYMDRGRLGTIIGIVARTQGPSPTGPARDNVIFEPTMWEAENAFYIIRAQSARLDALMKAAPAKLLQTNRRRVFGYIAPFRNTRDLAFRGHRAVAIVLTSVSVLLVATTSLGIAGLSSYWVTQRQRQIGVRRALGARRAEIVQYFLIENLLLLTVGELFGALSAFALNSWLVAHFQMQRIDPTFVLCGLAAMVLLGQVSVIFPSLRAARVPPASAARGTV